MTDPEFIAFYARYGPLLYSIALQVCSTPEQSQDLFIHVNRKIHSSDFEIDFEPACVKLIRLIIQTAYAKGYAVIPENKLRLSQLKDTPVLNELVSIQMSLADYCTQHNITRQQLVAVLREEFNKIRKP